MERALRVAPYNIRSVANKLKSEGFDHVKSLTGIDRPENGRIDLVYHLSSYLNPTIEGNVIEIRTEVDRTNPTIASISDLFQSCKYMELETRDLFGVKFSGNDEPDPFILPNELKGAWPLRKDYKLKEEGIE